MNLPQSSGRLSRPVTMRPRSRVIQDVTPTQWTPRRASVNPLVAAQQSTASITPPVTLHQHPKRSHKVTLVRWLKRYGFIVAALIAVIVIVRLSASPSVGGPVIAAYAIGVFMLRISSRVTFGLAALALASVGIELTLLPEPGRANSGALLVFLLLGVGLVSTIFETRRLESKIKFPRRR